MQFFQRLGAEIETRWRAINYDDHGFPDLAAAALREADAVSHVDPWDVIRWLLQTDELPNQADLGSGFGNPPVTLFHGPRFRVDLYYWLDGTTSIHRHSFSGAFQVFVGASVHSEYRFEDVREVNPHFLIGRTVLQEVGLLHRGEVQTIRSGSAYIHSLFHLDRPSVSLVVRTHFTPQAAPLFTYLPPYFAVDRSFGEPVTTRRLQSVQLLLGMHHPEADPMIHGLLARSDFQTAFEVLEILYDHVVVRNPLGEAVGNQVFQRYLETTRKTHGEWADLVFPVLEEQQSLKIISQRRNRITETEHRFFMALLLNVRDRRKLLELVGQEYPGHDPVERVLDWVDELGNARTLGSAEANVLGLPVLGEEALSVFACLLRGTQEEELVSRFVQEFGVGEAEESEQRARGLVKMFRTSPLFRRMLAE